MMTSTGKFHCTLLAIAEVLLITLGVNLGIRWVMPAAWTPQPAEYATLAYAGQEAVRLLARHGAMVLVGFGFLYAFHRTTPREAGVTFSVMPLRKHLQWGIGAFLIAFLPWHAWLLLNELVPLGAGHELWEYYAVAEYTPGFIATILVTAVLVPPVFEEIFVRGYVRTLLERAGGPLVGIVVSAVLFSLGHGHYYQADALLLGLLVLGMLGFAVLAFVVWRTRSVVPAIIAHALLNLPWPHTFTVMAILTAVSVLGLVLLKDALRDEWGVFRQLADRKAVIHASLAGAIAALVMVGLFFFRSAVLPLLGMLVVVFIWARFVAAFRSPRPA